MHLSVLALVQVRELVIVRLANMLLHDHVEFFGVYFLYYKVFDKCGVTVVLLLTSVVLGYS